MRRTDKFTLDTMLCNECHKAMFVPRRLGHKRTMGHIKDMYCPWCKKGTQFTEYLSDQFVRNMDGEPVGELDYGT